MIITLESVLASSEKLIKERGRGYIYTDQNGLRGDCDESQGCFYVHRTDEGGDALPDVDFGSTMDDEDIAKIHSRTPGCHVGAVLIDLGIPAEWFDGMEGKDADDIITKLRCEHRIEPGVRKYLCTFQGIQDAGETWGHARERALNALNP